MKNAPRIDDSRYSEVVEDGLKKHVRDLAVLSAEIMVSLNAHDALSCSSLALMTSAGHALVEQALNDLMSKGRVTRMKRSGLRGPAHFYWSAAGDISDERVRFNGATILSAFQRAAVKRS
jgi:predicted transcriptional regulator